MLEHAQTQHLGVNPEHYLLFAVDMKHLSDSVALTNINNCSPITKVKRILYQLSMFNATSHIRLFLGNSK